jgi:hypothetical protein
MIFLTRKVGDFFVFTQTAKSLLVSKHVTALKTDIPLIPLMLCLAANNVKLL